MRIAALLAVVLAAAHLHVLAEGPAYVGPALPLAHLCTLAVALALLGLATAVGHRALQLAGVPLERPLEALPFAAAAGVALVGTTLLAAGAVGLLRPWGVFPLLAAFLFAARASLAPCALLAAALPGALREAVPSPLIRGVALAVTAVVALLLLPPSVAPPSDWDSLNYHLDVPAEYLETGRVHLPEDNLHAALIGPVQLLYVPLLALGMPAAPAVLNALLALLLAVAVVGVSARLLPGATAGLAAVALWGNTILLVVAPSPKVDATLPLYALLGHVALLLAWREGGRRMFLLSAALLGAGVGVKLQILPYILALAPLVAWTAWRRPWHGPDARESAVGAGARDLAIYAGLGLLGALPWLVRSQLLLGAPFYPLFTAPVLQPWLAAVVGAPTPPAGVDPYVFDWLGAVRAPFNLRDALLAPERLTVDIDRGAFFFSPLVLLAPLAPLAGRDARTRSVSWLLWGGLAYLALLLGVSPRTNLRYLIPGAVTLTVVACHAVALASERLLPRRFATPAALVVVLASLVYTVRAGPASLLGPSVLAHAAGTVSEVRYQLGPNRPGELRAVLQGAVPPEGRVLFIFEARGFQVGREVLQDPHGTNWPLLVASGATDDCLGGTGITHVVVDRYAAGYWESRGVDLGRLGLDDFQVFAPRCLALAAQSPGYLVYRIVG